MSIESRSRQYGKVFDHWQINEFLGSGSGGKTAVFSLVRSDSGWGASALKVINLIEERGDINALSDYRKSEYEHAREECSKNAEQEVRLMDDLRGNTNIVDYLDHAFVDWSDDSGFGRDLLIRMELLKDLRSEVRSGKIFTEREVLKIGRDICVALIRCHRKNILHRDVKPENIFRNKDGDYKLGDFGVSRVLDACPSAVASTGIGTYEYWPAEQMTGCYDKRVDIYSLGLVLYELCNQNRLPFAASTYVADNEVSKRLAGTPLPKPIDASLALSEVILKACAFDPDNRYRSTEEFLQALNLVASSLQKKEKGKTTGKSGPDVKKKTKYDTQKATPFAGGVAPVADPPQIPAPGEKIPYPGKPKRYKGIIMTLVLFFVAGAGAVTIWVSDAAADKKIIAGIIDEANTLCDAKNYDEAIVRLENAMDEYPHSDALKEKLDEVVDIQSDYAISAASTEPEKNSENAVIEHEQEEIEDSAISTQPSKVSPNVMISTYDFLGASEDYNTDRMRELEEVMSQKPFWGQNEIRRNEIKKVVFLNSKENKEDDYWDVSATGNNSVIAWEKDGVLYVASDGVITLGRCVAGLFSSFTNVTTIEFNDNIDTSQVTDMQDMFLGCWNLQTIDLSCFDTSNVTCMSSMFGSTAIAQLDVSMFDTTNVTSLAGMFVNCENLEYLDLSNFNTSKVVSMSSMFANCYALSYIDLSDFNTENVNDMNGMFYRCRSLKELDLSGFDTAKVKDMSWMFAACQMPQLDISGFDVDNLENVTGMFRNSSIDILNCNSDVIQRAYTNR